MKTPGAALRSRGRLIHRCQALQLNQAPHVVGEVLETYSPPRSYKPDAANQGPTRVVALCAEDILDPCPNARPASVAHFSQSCNRRLRLQGIYNNPLTVRNPAAAEVGQLHLETTSFENVDCGI